MLVNGFIRMKRIYIRIKPPRFGTENLGEEEKTMIRDILDLMKDNSRIELRGFNKINGCVLAEWSRKINCILKYIRTENITDTNILIKAVTGYSLCRKKDRF